MHREDLFAADTVGDAADGDGLVDAAMLLGNDGAFESLVALAVAFLDTDKDTNSIADVHFGKLGLHILLTENFDQIHNPILSYIDVHAGNDTRQRTAFL